MKIKKLMLCISGCVMLLSLGAVAQAATVTYYACVNNSTGDITIVSSTTTCATSAHKIQWNQEGPAGATGAKGATGATGPAGPPGASSAFVVHCGPNVFLQSIVCPGNNGTPLASTGTVVLTTNAVGGGFYLISASVNMVNSSGGFAECYATTVNTAPATGFTGIGDAILATVSVTDVIAVAANDSIELVCSGSPAAGTSSNPVWASLTATLVNEVNYEVYSDATGAITPPTVANKK
ncbi:MAG: collagen-like protein [Candidatus Acidiferrales bacterium]